MCFFSLGSAQEQKIASWGCTRINKLGKQCINYYDYVKILYIY
jgi:hypothetical protein